MLKNIGDLYFIDYYLPYRKDRDGNLPEGFYPHSGLILDLKNNNRTAIEHFYNIIRPLITNTDDSSYIICVVPSSNVNNTNSGIKQLGRKLSNQKTDAIDCLLRTKSIEKASHGGPRNILIHLNTIKVNFPEKVKGKDVILLDDVATTNSSIEACKKLLLSSGARTVKMLVLGKTKSAYA